MVTVCTVAQDDADKMKVDCWDSIALPEKFHKFFTPMLEMLSQFFTMWAGHLRHLHAGKHCIGLTSDDVSTLHSVLFY